MDRTRNNSPYSRPYQTTCGMQCGMPEHKGMNRGDYRSEKNIHHEKMESFQSYSDYLKKIPLAMAYVPTQSFHKTLEHEKAFQNGTIFPELLKPFYGKRGMKRC